MASPTRWTWVCDALGSWVLMRKKWDNICKLCFTEHTWYRPDLWKSHSYSHKTIFIWCPLCAWQSETVRGLLNELLMFSHWDCYGQSPARDELKRQPEQGNTSHAPTCLIIPRPMIFPSHWPGYLRSIMRVMTSEPGTHCPWDVLYDWHLWGMQTNLVSAVGLFSAGWELGSTAPNTSAHHSPSAWILGVWGPGRL